MARELKLTPEVQERIVKYLRAGSYVETAATAAGVHRDTFYEWLKRGAAKEEPYASFCDAVEEAQSMSEYDDVETVRRASAEQWQAAAWRLERRYPDKWGRRERIAPESKQQDPLQVVVRLSDVKDE